MAAEGVFFCVPRRSRDRGRCVGPFRPDSVTPAPQPSEDPAVDSSEGFVQLYENEFSVVAHAAYQILWSPAQAQEVTQEAFAVAFSRWPEVSRLDRPGAWVRRVAINMALKARRRNDRESSEIHEDTVDDGTDSLDDRASLAAAIRRLPGQQRLAVVLHYFHDLPVADVAESLGCAEGTVKVHLHRARHSLGRYLTDPSAEP